MIDFEKLAEFAREKPKKHRVLIKATYGRETSFYIFKKFDRRTISVDGPEYREVRTVAVVESFDGGPNYFIESNHFGDCKKIEFFYAKGDLKQKINKLHRSKSPKNRRKHIGVEIEMISKLDEGELKILLAENDLENHVEVKDDGSINSTSKFPYSYELCVLSDEGNIYKVLDKLCGVLRKNSSVNSSCGLHVHLDMRSRIRSEVYEKLFYSQPLLYLMCPKTRFKNGYCQPTMEYVRNSDGERYVGINRESYGAHKTFEVRMHSSTLDARKIGNWIKLLIRIADMPRNPFKKDQFFSAEVIKRKLRLGNVLKGYVDERLKKFEKEHEKTVFQIENDDYVDNEY